LWGGGGPAAAPPDPSGRTPHPLLVYAQAQALRFGGDGEGALELLARYLHTADPWTGAAARIESAVILRGLGRVAEASRYCDAAVAAFRDIEEGWGTAMALMFRAELDKTAGDFRGAIAALEEAAAAGRLLGTPDNHVTWLYSDLAWLRACTGDYAAAHAAADLADQNARAHGDSGHYLRLVRAELAWREGHLAEAIRLCEDVLREGGVGLSPWVPLRPLAAARLGVLTLAAGDTARGTALLRDALGMAAAGGDRPAAATAVEGLAAAALRANGAKRAAALLGAADSIRGAVDHSSLDAPATRAAAEAQLGETAFDAAYRHGRGLPYDEALGLAQASTDAAVS
jgi:tetratricopeptide (TPR) repeat protein